MNKLRNLAQLLQDLTGQTPPLPNLDLIPEFPSDGLGYSQFNELLLLLGYDRVTHAFFQFLVDGKLDYAPGGGLHSLQELEAGVERARQLALLFFGNVKFGFKRLARDSDELQFYYESTRELDVQMLKDRHRPMYAVEPIPSGETYYLGYVVRAELNEKLAKDPSDKAALGEQAKLAKVKEKGIRNHHAYLVSDHMDVYVATSMRRRHEYVEVAEFVNQVFSQELIRPLQLRFFDPTQAYCPDRIDKGLAEALMLKRAKCTIYLAQESDTLGKDSELASTLAQGKPVIAYVPSPTEADILRSVTRLAEMHNQPEEKVILDRLQALSPDLAWTDTRVRRWLEMSPEEIDRPGAFSLLVDKTRNHFDKRAQTLMESHPLGIQVNLDTGVANGVLVVRKIEDCAKLIYRIVTRTLEFKIEEKTVGTVKYHLLRETVSNSVFRVMTGDAILTNCFWNFYLEPSE